LSTTDDEPTIEAPRARPKVAHAPLPTGQAPTPTPESPSVIEKFAEEDPRTRAARRAAELIDHGVIDADGAEDKFYIDPKEIPDGWSYEWRRNSVLGKDDPSYQVTLAQKGWEPVPADRHPAMMPKGFKGNTIEREGMILMERPLVITQAASEREYRNARAQVGAKEAQLSGVPSGTAPRDNKGDSLVRIKKTYEPLAVPDK
jgi:hypothetical protein